MRIIAVSLISISIISVVSACVTTVTAPKGFFDNVKEKVGKDLKRLMTGCTEFIPSYLENERLKKLQKESGIAALSFSEFKKLEVGKEDFWKTVKAAIFLPISPEFFFYSYVAIPMFMSGPWAWKALPSMFDKDPDDIQTRETVLNRRKTHAVITSLVTLAGDMVEEENPKKCSMRAEQIEIIEKALKAKSVADALGQMKPWFLTPKLPEDKCNLEISEVPGSIVKDCCRALGIDAVPNIWLLNKLNNGELSKYFEKIRESDRFLSTIGVNKLASHELSVACRERGIADRGGEASMRKDLLQWLDVALTPPEIVGDGKTAMMVNPQNRRMALMALHVAKGCKGDKELAIYRPVVF